MVPAQDRTEKLVSLTYALLTTRTGYTRSQLREMVDDYQGLGDEAFERKFERDKQTLRNLGVSLVDGRGRREGESPESDAERRYRVLADEYRLPALELDAHEAAVLGLATGVVAGGGLGAQATRAAERLGVDPQAQNAVFSPSVDGGEEHLEALIRHVSAGNPVRFRYRAANGEQSQRVVMPWGLGHRHGHWYLAAGDTARDGERLFRLDRIIGGVVQASPKADEHVPDAYGRPDRFSMSKALDALERIAPTRMASLLVTGVSGGTLAARAQRRTAVDGAGEELIVAYADEAALAREVAAEGLEVLEPASLGAAVAEVLDAAVLAHAGPGGEPKLTRHRGGRVSAEETVSRALDLVAYVVQRGGATAQELMDRFGLSRQALEAELTRLRFCGVPNGQHDELLDVDWDHDVVSITNAQALSRPMNLNLVEATTVLIGLDALASAPEGTLSAESTAAVERLASRLRGLRPELADFDRILAVRAAAREAGPLVAELAVAIDECRVVHLDYAGTSARSARDVEPIRLVDRDGHSYLQAWCRLRQGPRTFRLDRIIRAEVLDEGFDVDPERAARVRAAVLVPDVSAASAVVRWAGSWAAAAAAHRPERTGTLEGEPVTEIRVHDVAHLLRLAAASSGQVSVLGPAPVRAQLHERLLARAQEAHAALGRIRAAAPEAGGASETREKH